ncbi:MAG: hypothetical protein LBK63_14020 [Treponema sp.]|nr:hypothetical protein [Treponema sp.]
MPNPEKALTLDFVEGTDEGILIGNDMLIPYNSIEGAITVELLNALANGEDIEAIVNNLEDEVKDIFGGITDMPNRGVVKNNDGRWAKGLINYRWGSISATHKTAVKDAMTVWTNSTGGEVKFSELSETCWNTFQLGIYAIGVITIRDANIDRNGLSNVGYISGNRTELKINQGLSGEALSITALHELGHCIGLYHEHQRYDQNEWITVSRTGTDYDIIPKDVSGWRWEKLRVKVGWWTISIPYLCFWEQKNSTLYGDFDFDSIMLYSDEHIKVKKIPAGNKTLTIGVSVPVNKKLSPTDILTAKKIY